MCHISASHRLKYIQAQPCGTTCASWINTRYPGTTPRSILEPVDSHLNKQLVSADDHLNEVLQTFFPSPLSLSVAHAVVIYLQKWHEEKKKVTLPVLMKTSFWMRITVNSVFIFTVKDEKFWNHTSFFYVLVHNQNTGKDFYDQSK